MSFILKSEISFNVDPLKIGSSVKVALTTAVPIVVEPATHVHSNLKVGADPSTLCGTSICILDIVSEEPKPLNNR